MTGRVDIRSVALRCLVPAPGDGGADAPVAPDAVTVHQDAAMYAGLLSPGAAVTHQFRHGYAGYLVVVHGGLASPALDEGGAAIVRGEPSLELRGGNAGAEVLLVGTRDR